MSPCWVQAMIEQLKVCFQGPKPGVTRTSWAAPPILGSPRIDICKALDRSDESPIRATYPKKWRHLVSMPFQTTDEQHQSAEGMIDVHSYVLKFVTKLEFIYDFSDVPAVWSQVQHVWSISWYQSGCEERIQYCKGAGAVFWAGNSRHRKRLHLHQVMFFVILICVLLWTTCLILRILLLSLHSCFY